MENKNSSCSKVGIIISILALIVSLAAYFCPKKTNDLAASSTLDEKVKSAVVDLVKQNPQMLMDAMGEGIAKKREDTIKQLGTDVFVQKDEIAKQSLKFGKADGKSTVICFFDPLCKHCIDFQKSMLKLIEAGKDVNFEMMPVAVLGDDSVVLAKTYFAVYEKGADKAAKFIAKMTEDGSAMDKSAIEKALKSIGLDPKEIATMLDEADKKLASNGMMAEKLKLPFVPAIFVIKDSKIDIVQATGVDDILPYIENQTAKEAAPNGEAKEDKAEEKTSENSESKPADK